MRQKRATLLTPSYLRRCFIKKEKNGNRPLTISFPYDNDEQPWSRTIEVKENFTLVKLDQYIQAIVGFDDDHLYEFFIGKVKTD